MNKGNELQNQSYSDLMHAGGMTHPKTSFKHDTTKFYELFCANHPKNGIKKEAGIISGFAKLLHSEFPQYNYKVLYLVAKVFTVVRLREVNNLEFKRRLLARKKKNKDENATGNRGKG